MNSAQPPLNHPLDFKGMDFAQNTSFADMISTFVHLPDDKQQEIFKETLSCHEFERLCKNRKAAYDEKYHSKKQKKRPQQARIAYYLEEVVKIVRMYKQRGNPDYLAAFLIQLYTNTRIGEVNCVRKYSSTEVIVDTPKTRGSGNSKKILPVHSSLEPLLAYTQWTSQRTKAYLKKVQVNVLRALGEDFNPVYGRSAPTKIHPEGRPLYQFSTHSVRRTATDWCGECGVDPYYIALFRGDKPQDVLGTQGLYRSYKPHVLKDYLDFVFAPLNDYLERSGTLAWLTEYARKNYE